jgi:UDP-glucose 4-epimerase
VAGTEGAYRERHINETHIIPLALRTVVSRKPTFTIFGDDYQTPDGSCVRDYIHVKDLANAHLLAIECLQAGQYEIYNLGNGQGFSNKPVLGVVEKVTG